MRKRLPMSQVKEVLRVLWEQKRSVRATARSVGVSVGVVSKIHKRALAQGLSWEAVAELPEPELQGRIYGRGALRARPGADASGSDVTRRDA